MMKRIWFIFKYRFNIGKDAKFIKALRGIGAKVNLHSKSAFFVNGKYEIDDVNGLWYIMMCEHRAENLDILYKNIIDSEHKREDRSIYFIKTDDDGVIEKINQKMTIVDGHCRCKYVSIRMIGI